MTIASHVIACVFFGWLFESAFFLFWFFADMAFDVIVVSNESLQREAQKKDEVATSQYS